MKKLLPILLILSIVGFVIFSLFVPNVAGSVLKKKKELTLLQNEEKVIPVTSAAIEKARENISLIEAAFPTKKDLVLVAQTIDSLAAQAGVSVELHFDSEEFIKNESGDSVIPVTITVEGGYAGIVRFLEIVRTGKYFFTLLTLEGQAQSGIKNVNTLTVKANLYVANEQ